MGALASDWIKFKRTWIKALVFLGPFGVVSLTGVHYAVSHGGMVNPGNHTVNWMVLIRNINFLLIPALVLGLTLLASLMTGLEHQGHTWKQLLALPVPRYRMVWSKFVWLVAFLACSGTLIVIGTLVLAWLIGLHGPVPIRDVLQEGFAPYLASYALIGIQLLLSVLIANQSFAISVGILGVIASFAKGLIPSWIPWVYPASAAPGGTNQVHYVGLGLIVCVLVMCLGTYLFARHQVK